jgi:hypothetical protein
VIPLFNNLLARRNSCRCLVDVCLPGGDLVTELDIVYVLRPVQKSEKTISFVLGVFVTDLGYGSPCQWLKVGGERTVAEVFSPG